MPSATLLPVLYAFHHWTCHVLWLQECLIRSLVKWESTSLGVQTAGGNNTMKKTDWENMDLGGGGGGAKAAEIFK